MKKVVAGLMGCGLLVSCGNDHRVGTTPTALVEIQWVLEGFDSPECVLPTGDGKTLYVSNVGGDGRAQDGNGFISIITQNGQVVEKSWVSGLNAPKGMAIDGQFLFVSDIDHLVKIDIATKEIVERLPVEGAAFLNDVAVTDEGVLVSDSGKARIYSVNDGVVSVWLADEQLGGVNGLTAQADRLLITTMEKGELLSFDWSTRELSVIADEMKNADGIEQHSDGFYVVSSWPGKLYRISEEGEKTVVLDTEAEKIFLNDITLVGDTVYAPNWEPGTVRAIKLTANP